MRAPTLSRCLSISLAAALLTACGAASVPIGGMNNSNGPAGSSGGKKIFFYTGKERSFVVPPGVTQLAVDVRGAGGADAGFKSTPSFLPPAAGGIVEATIPVKPGEKLYVFVGGRGVRGSGGFNGGGSAAYGGGGASDIREGGETLQDRIIVAAGGGGSGVAVYFYYFTAGDGGGLKGSPGLGGYSGTCEGGGGGGGTQHRGGAGGHGGKHPTSTSGQDGIPGGKGTLGKGGDGGTIGGSYGTDGGGGGGGYYGGGGGGSGADAPSGCYGGSFGNLVGGGGGGGSSYIESSATNGKMLTGEATARGDGRVVIRWN